MLKVYRIMFDEKCDFKDEINFGVSNYVTWILLGKILTIVNFFLAGMHILLAC